MAFLSLFLVIYRRLSVLVCTGDVGVYGEGQGKMFLVWGLFL